jgi:tRNA A-37 threonylcarbamoyl transferase component Bud32
MQPGQKVGPFDIEKRIGSGAMGTVYRALYRKTRQRVAIKIISPGVLDNETALARFEREAEVLKQLNHRNIVRFYVAAQHHGVPYYAMEFIQGEPLDNVLQRRGRLTWEETVEFGKQVCAALQHAHEQGIVHRDLKPSNLMVTPDGTVKLTDFGIAKDLDVTQLTAANATVGTAAYMSPEQCRGERNLSHKSDLYSFGVVLYELLTGRKPFQAETTMDMFLQHVEGTFERPARIVLEVPVWLDTLVCQLLEKKPEHRPYDAAMIAQALLQVQEKVAALQSAGVDVARARLVDRSPRDAKPTAEDKKDARKVLSGLRRGRRKTQKKPLHEKVWVQALGILVVLAGLGGILHQVFQPPSADKLYKQAQAKMHSASFDERREARDGPVALFLRYYGNANDDRAREIRDWAAEMDLTLKWSGLLSRRGKFGPEDEAEQQARDALEQEERGELARAEELWQQVAKHKGDAEDTYGLAVLADRCLQQVRSVPEKEKSLRDAMTKARNLEGRFKPANEAQRLASNALAGEELKDVALAYDRWAELKTKYGKDLDHHSWTLLASKKVRELKPKLHSEEEQLAARIKAIENQLAEAGKFTEIKPGLARCLYEQIITLYANDIDAKVGELVAQARKSMDKLAASSAGEAPGKSPSPSPSGP